MELKRSSISATISRTWVRGVNGSCTTDVIRSMNEGCASLFGPASSASGSRRSGADSATGREHILNGISFATSNTFVR
jgi:hypothetical protein